MKDEAIFENIKWKKNILSFDVKSTTGHANRLTAMLPFQFRNLKITSINGESLFKTWKIKSKEYVIIPVQSGETTHFEVYYK
jgi:hypothetical protein